MYRRQLFLKNQSSCKMIWNIYSDFISAKLPFSCTVGIRRYRIILTLVLNFSSERDCVCELPAVWAQHSEVLVPLAVRYVVFLWESL